MNSTVIQFAAGCSLLLGGLPACETQNHQAETSTVAPQARLAHKAASSSCADQRGKSGACPAEKAGHECACGAATEARNTKIVEGIDSASGKRLQAVGAKLGSAPRATVGELLANPDKFAGKTVRLEGDVSAMCHHRRAWFALQDEGERSGRYVRVMTAPEFLVPAGSVGKRVRAEGRVSFVEVPVATAQHLAAEHQLGRPDATRAPSRRIVIRAFGAEFI